jgi:hypothetical protein
MDTFEIVNGEVSPLIDGQYYARVDKPIVHLEIDVENDEFLLLHQSEGEINQIIDDVKKIIDADPRVEYIDATIYTLEQSIRIEVVLKILPFNNPDTLYLEYTRKIIEGAD